MYGPDGLIMSVFSIFPCTTLHSFHVFPHFLFLLFLFSFLFPSWHFIYLELSFFLNFPSLLFIFLVSFSCSSLCFCSFMVDYSLIRLDFPSVSFFFARLCSLLEAVGRKCPKVGLFVEKNCPYRSILLFMFP